MGGCAVGREGEQSQLRSDPHSRLSDEYVTYRLKPEAVCAVAEIANRLTNNANPQIDPLALQLGSEFLFRCTFLSINANDANHADASGRLFNSQI